MLYIFLVSSSKYFFYEFLLTQTQIIVAVAREVCVYKVIFALNLKFKTIIVVVYANIFFYFLSSNFYNSNL